MTLQSDVPRPRAPAARPPGRAEPVTTSRVRDYRGSAFLSAGFRPFFLLGALYSALSMVLWLPQFYGALELTTLFAPVDWHIHEMFFGYLAAIVTGFLFTAVPNWTGRMPIRGTPLLLLVVLWFAGRLAVTFSGQIGWLAAMMIDVAFLAAVTLVIAREIIAGSNWRNLKVLAPLILLLIANAGFHLEVHWSGVSDISRRSAIAVPVVLIMLIGGRIIPSFTRNWLARENPGRFPAPFGRFDIVSLAVTVTALAVWVALPVGRLTGGLLALAAVLQLLRLARWSGERTLREPLIAILHVGYGFIPVGLALLAAAQFWPDLQSIAGIHALGAGAIGTMTLAVMVRATLGHTGQALQADPAIKLLLVSVLVSAGSRIVQALDIGAPDTLLEISAFAWFIAFAGFGVVFAPSILNPKS